MSAVLRYGKPLAVALAGVLVGTVMVVLVLPAGPFVNGEQLWGGRLYYSATVEVPSSDISSEPLRVTLHGATFDLWWPKIPPGAYSGVIGVAINATEPSGVIDQTATGCAGCGWSQESWFSADGEIGITFNDHSLGTVTLLVAM